MAVNSPLQRNAMIVAAPGFWRDALVSLVRAQPGLCVSRIIDNLADAEDGAEASLAVVIADSSVGEDHLERFVAWLRTAYPAVRCVVVADTRAQQVRYGAAGAHATLLKGCLDEGRLRYEVEQVM